MLAHAEAAQPFIDGAESGASFASVVSEAGLQTEVASLGTLAESQITDANLAGALRQVIGLSEAEQWTGPHAVADESEKVLDSGLTPRPEQR